MNLLSIALLLPAIAAYSLSQLAQHNKLRWRSDDYGFWGKYSYERKYKNFAMLKGTYIKDVNPKNWYYRFFKIKYAERWFTFIAIVIIVICSPSVVMIAMASIEDLRDYFS